MVSDHAHRVRHLHSMQGDDPRERSLLRGTIKAYDRWQTNASGGTFLVVFDDESHAFHKRHDQLSSVNALDYGHDLNTPPLHECAAWHFAKALGPQYEALLPPTVYINVDGEWGSLSQELAGIKPGTPAYTEAPEQVNDAGFFDVLIGQQDRHLNNFKWDPGAKRLGLFDHGFAFPGVGRAHRVRSGQLQMQRRYRHPAITDAEQTLIQRVLDSGDLLGIEPLLEPERAAQMRVRLERLLELPRVIPHKNAL